MEPAISLSGVGKTFGATVAVRDLDLVVPTGALYGFIGPNGAGKTTSLRMIMSILFPDRGRVSVLGCQSAQEAKDRIGYLPEERGVYRKMKVGAFLIYIARLKGVHYAIESGRLAAESAFASLQRGATPSTALSAYDDAIRSGFIGRDLYEVRDMRQVFGRGFFVGGALASAMIVSKGHLPPKDFPTHPNAAATLMRTGRARSYPPADGKLTFDKLSSVFASGNRTRDDQPNHLRIRNRVPRDVAEAWAWMCPAQVYEMGRSDGDGTVTVQMTPSNCVQCGAISAKGGRLTPPEGGSGPEYTNT